MLQIGGESSSRQASQVSEEHLLVCGPRHPAHGLQQHLGILRNVLGEPHESIVIAPGGDWKGDSHGTDKGSGQQRNCNERYSSCADGTRHLPHRGVWIEVHPWTDNKDSETEHDNGDHAGHAHVDSAGLAGLVDIEEVEGCDYFGE